MKLGKLIAAGTRSTVHQWGPDVVAKVPLPSTPDSWIRCEAVYTAAVRRAGAPAPRVVDVVEFGGRQIALYEHIGGRSMWDQLLDAPSSATELGLLLASIHQQIVCVVGHVELPHQRDRLAGKIRRAAACADPELLHAIDLLPDGWTSTGLCHGDLHPGNVIMAGSGPVVIDWFDACRGVAIGDVARSSLLMGASGATLDSIPHLPGAQPAVLHELHDAYLQSMRAHLAIDDDDYTMWRRVEAAARLGEGLARDQLLSIWRGVGPVSGGRVIDGGA